MSKATYTHSTGAPTSLSAAGAGLDAELIRLCSEFIAGVAIYGSDRGISNRGRAALENTASAIGKQLAVFRIA